MEFEDLALLNKALTYFSTASANITRAYFTTKVVMMLFKKLRLKLFAFHSLVIYQALLFFDFMAITASILNLFLFSKILQSAHVPRKVLASGVTVLAFVLAAVVFEIF